MPGLSASQIAWIEALVAVLQTVVLVVAGIVAWRQLREVQRARYLNAILRIYDELGSRDAYADADAALGLPTSPAEYNEEERELAIATVRVYEKLGFLVETGMIPASYLIPLYSRRIIWSWDALEPFIKEQRDQRDNLGPYRMSGDGRYFEKLTKRALNYRQREFPGGRRAHPPVPQAYRDRLQAIIARGDRIGSGAYHEHQ